MERQSAVTIEAIRQREQEDLRKLRASQDRAWASIFLTPNGFIPFAQRALEALPKGKKGVIIINGETFTIREVFGSKKGPGKLFIISYNDYLSKLKAYNLRTINPGMYALVMRGYFQAKVAYLMANLENKEKENKEKGGAPVEPGLWVEWALSHLEVSLPYDFRGGEADTEAAVAAADEVLEKVGKEPMAAACPKEIADWLDQRANSKGKKRKREKEAASAVEAPGAEAPVADTLKSVFASLTELAGNLSPEMFREVVLELSKNTSALATEEGRAAAFARLPPNQPLLDPLIQAPRPSKALPLTMVAKWRGLWGR